MTAQSSSADRLLPMLLLALTGVTGLVDAASFLSFGHVFTANMTGNVVFLGFAAFGIPGLSVARSAAALVSFLAGAVAGGRIANHLATEDKQRWLGAAFGLEAALLAAAAVACRGGGIDLSMAPSQLYPAIVLTGLAMGVRNAVVRKVAVRDLTTTVLTLTVTGIAADSILAGGDDSGSSRRLTSVFLMFAGAACGAWMLRFSSALPLGVAAAISGLCALAAILANRAGGGTSRNRLP
jgi:uncharacterized membrane protein YoaK (UPF0700 family)